MAKARSKLARAHREKLLVAFTRPFEQGSILGYVVDIGPKFFLMTMIAPDEFRFNGFSCLRLADVRNLSVPHKYSAFVETALKKLRERLPKKPHVVLGSLSELLLSASEHFPLVTIHRERVNPEVCYIGRVDSISRGLLDFGK